VLGCGVEKKTSRGKIEPPSWGRIERGRGGSLEVPGKRGWFQRLFHLNEPNNYKRSGLKAKGCFQGPGGKGKEEPDLGKKGGVKPPKTLERLPFFK